MQRLAGENQGSDGGSQVPKPGGEKKVEPSQARGDPRKRGPAFESPPAPYYLPASDPCTLLLICTMEMIIFYLLQGKELDFLRYFPV